MRQPTVYSNIPSTIALINSGNSEIKGQERSIRACLEIMQGYMELKSQDKELDNL